MVYVNFVLHWKLYVTMWTMFHASVLINSSKSYFALGFWLRFC